MIPADSFLDAMRAKWAEYGNVGSSALSEVWRQIAGMMNRQTTQPCLPRPVIPAAKIRPMSSEPAPWEAR